LELLFIDLKTHSSGDFENVFYVYFDKTSKLTTSRQSF